ncbi:MAG: phosphoribosylaminoimidazolesuccinocarboxamide synthase [Candidatus Thermoplasmatota archaeon]|nr:phosphoribosylaminoimidazolesuccinocarboxamide synthase [Candidatus Thermoplasmatota archaeon]
MSIVTETNLSYPVFKKGKVRDVYDVGENLLLIVTDRISAFDYVLHEPIPNKGICLTQISAFWFDYFKDLIPNHMISADVDMFPEDFKVYEDVLFGRSMLVKKAQAFPVECIVRGYISGSAWKSYKEDRTVCGIRLPDGLKESDQFDEPLFTPSTKADTGHDENISFEDMAKLIGENDAEVLKDISLKMYMTAAEYARKRGIIIADTKFEFGKIGDTIIVIDEVLTPDSSRFWSAEEYEPGKGQSSYDKQYVRDYLSSTGWDKNSSPPHLPREVVEGTEKRYIEAYELITGKRLILESAKKA